MMKKSKRTAKPQELSIIFKEIRALISKYENPLRPKNDTNERYDLWSYKDLVISNRKRKEVYFAGVIQYGTYVGFYYMPIYVDTDLKEVFDTELLSLLKGKSCFHIKNFTPTLKRQIKSALKTGFSLYRKRGWV